MHTAPLTTTPLLTFCSALHLHATARGSPPGPPDVLNHYLRLPRPQPSPLPLSPSVTSASPAALPILQKLTCCSVSAPALCLRPGRPGVAPQSSPPPRTFPKLRRLPPRPRPPRRCSHPTCCTAQHSASLVGAVLLAGWGLGEEDYALPQSGSAGLVAPLSRGPGPAVSSSPRLLLLVLGCPSSSVFPSCCPHPSASPTRQQLHCHLA